MEYMMCLNCYGEIPQDSIFCPFCGVNISEAKKKFEKEEIEKESQGDNRERGKTYNQDAILKRAFLFLEDGAFDRADTYLENVLDSDPENAWAYIGKLMIDSKIQVYEDLENAKESFEKNGNYIKALRFGEENLKEELKRKNAECLKNVQFRKEQESLEEIYQTARADMVEAMTEQAFVRIAENFEKIKEYKDAAILAEECREQAECSKAKDEQTVKIAGAVAIGVALFAVFLVVLCIVAYSTSPV